MPRDDLSSTQVRVLAAVCLAGESAYLAWTTRGEWAIALPALLLVHLVGLLGFGLYWLVARRWRHRATHEELFISSSLFTVVVVMSVTYAGGEWMGVQSVLGSVTGAALVGITLVLGRLAIWGPLGDAE